jgi:hypothetical protein
MNLQMVSEERCCITTAEDFIVATWVKHWSFTFHVISLTTVLLRTVTCQVVILPQDGMLAMDM